MSVFRSLSIAVCVLVASVAQPVPGWSQADAETNTIRMPYAEFYPFTFTSAEGTPQGYNISLIEDLAERLGYEMEFVRANNPSEFLELLDAGEVDISPLLALTPARLEHGRATRPLGAFKVQVFVRRDHEAQVAADLSGARVGAVRGSISHRQATALPFVDVVLFEKPDDLIMPLLSGRVDAVVSVGDIFLERLRASDVDEKVRHLEEELLSIPYGILVRPDLVGLHGALDEAVGGVIESGTLPLLHERWFGRSKGLFDAHWVWWFVGEFVLVCAIIFALLRYSGRLKKNSQILGHENKANRLLIDALNSLETAIIIYDHDMRAIHWNDGVKQHLPDVIADLKVGATFTGIADANAFLMAEQNDVSPSELRELSQGLRSKLKAGEQVQYTQKTESGLILDVRHFPMGETHFATTYVNITSQHEQRETIECQARELEERNEQLLNFAAIAAHDLKAPLVQQKTLMGFITEDMETADVTIPRDVRENFEMMEMLSTRMSNLIRDLLDYAKAGSRDETACTFSPNERLDHIIDLIGLHEGFRLDIQSRLPEISVDPTAFDTVMRNLISNAVKHHDMETGRIQISAEFNAEEVVLKVEDDGPGIPDEFLRSIFEPFKRLTSKVEGSGLGLALIDKIVKSWGGTIDVRPAQGRGSIFRIRIPQSIGNTGDKGDIVVAFPERKAAKA